LTPCTWVKLADGSVAIVKHAKEKTPKCRFCRKSSVNQCDAQIGTTLGGEKILCNAPICGGHTIHVLGLGDACPKHSMADL
jgi:hypothetical protein